MKFLIKIEDAINQFILSLMTKFQHLTPHFIFHFWHWLMALPSSVKAKFQATMPKARIILLKFVGYSTHYLTLARGHLVAILIYVRSEEFKNKNKKEMILSPLKKFKTEPIRAMTFVLLIGFFSVSGFYIFKVTSKIVVGTKALRSPASAEHHEEPILVFKKLKYTSLDNKDFHLDVTIEAKSLEERDKLIPIEKEIEEHLLGIKIKVNQLPLTKDDIKAIQAEMYSKISGAKIHSVSIKQVLEGRPKYFLETEKHVSFKDLNLQLFLEDTRRNRQIWVDFTALTSNRNIALFLKDHEIEVRDYINMNVEPVIPQLPIEEEGRQIIKEKIKIELNEYLKKSEIEGKILEIYVDYIIVS